jgi:hypothetical protein
MNIARFLRRCAARNPSAAGAAFALVCTMLSGCTVKTTAPPVASPGVAITGVVHGGQNPVSGSHVYVYSTSTASYGGASQSLLTSVTTGNFPTTKDASGN